MKRKITLAVSLAAKDTTAIVEALASVGWLPDGDPTRVQIDRKKGDADRDWRSAELPKARQFYASFPNGMISVVPCHVRTRVVSIELSEYDLVRWFSAIPFEVATVASIHDEWDEPPLGEYKPPFFADSHVPLGWACAFRGNGHKNLMSRR